MNKMFTIKQGEHDSGNQFSLNFGQTEQIFDIMFDESCLYTNDDSEHDWNKAFGWSNSLLPYYWKEGKKWQTGHHKNSVRLGWRSDGKQIELAMYTYQNGKRVIKPIMFVPVNSWIRVGMFIRTDEFGIRLVMTVKSQNASIHQMDLTDYKIGWGYRLYPYFGGQAKAPHIMRFHIKTVTYYV